MAKSAKGQVLCVSDRERGGEGEGETGWVIVREESGGETCRRREELAEVLLDQGPGQESDPKQCG